MVSCNNMKLLRQIFILVLFAQPCTSLYSNQTLIGWGKVNNIYFTYTENWPLGLTRQKTEILATLAHRWSNHLNINTPVLLDVGSMGVYPDSQLAYVRIDSFNWNEDKPNRKYGLIIKMFLPDLDIKDRFNLVANSLDKYDSIHRSHNRPGEAPHFGSQVKSSSIPLEKIMAYMQSPVNSSEFVYSSPINFNHGSRYPSPISFFYLNKKFHFYVSDSTLTTEDLQTQKDSLTPLTASSLFEIVPFSRNTLIFNKFDQFYAVHNQNSSYAQGPYVITGIPNSRSYVLAKYEDEYFFYSNDYLNLQFITFETNDTNRIKKVLFVPELDLVISDYQKKEAEILDKELNKHKTPDQVSVSNSINWTTPMLLISILLAGLVLSLTLKKQSGR